MSIPVVIFAGGLGTRLGEITDKIPKPLVEIDNMPILWHIMKIYSYYNFNNFIILTGYKQHLIKKFFIDYSLYVNDIKIQVENNNISYIKKDHIENWNISIIDTGIETLTGSRLIKIKELINTELFLLTYGDGVSNINLNNLVEAHKKSNNTITLTAVQPNGKYGNLNINDNNCIIGYEEKPKGDGNWINGGFAVCNYNIFNYLIEGDFSDTLKILSEKNKLGCYKHNGFWKSVDTLQDKLYLDSLCKENKAFWKTW